MNPSLKAIAAVVLRIQSIGFAFYALLDLTYLPPYWRRHLVVYGTTIDAANAQDFAFAVTRVVSHAALAFIFFVYAERIGTAIARSVRFGPSEESPQSQKDV